MQACGNSYNNKNIKKSRDFGMSILGEYIMHKHSSYHFLICIIFAIYCILYAANIYYVSR